MWRQHGEVVKDREARARMASFPRCVTLGKFLKLPEPLFPHLENGDDHCTYLREAVGKLVSQHMEAFRIVSRTQ